MLRPLLALLILAVAAPFALAGHYEARTTSGLTASFAGAGHAYPPTYDKGTCRASAPGSNGTGQINGTLSTVFDWIPDYAGDTAPSSVVVWETCSVDADAKKYGGGSPTATANNGLDVRFCAYVSGSGPYGANGVDASANSSGTAPRLQAGGDTVTVNDCSPSR